jgi:TorA maturation chaperone TorD
LLPPDPVRFASIAAAGEYLDDADIDRYAFYGAWKAFAEAAATAQAEQLTAEYVRLFASGVSGALCPPTESYYRAGADGGKIAALMAQVERFYGDLGLSPTAGSEAPDHASTELEAMSVLCSQESAAREVGSTEGTVSALLAEDRFLRGHLAAWFPEFRERVSNTAGVGRFYGSLIEAIYAFIVHDADFVSLLRSRMEGVAV